jgi:hypothetical protein
MFVGSAGDRWSVAMSIIQNTSAITRFRVSGKPSEIHERLETIRERLSLRCMQGIDDYPGVESGWGFVRYSDYLDCDMMSAQVLREPYAAWKFRWDERKVSAKLINAEFAKAIEKEIETKRECINTAGGLVAPDSDEAGRKPLFISRERKREIKEQIKLRLLAKTPPTPDCCDVVWNIQDGVVYLASTSPKTVNRFISAWETSFWPLGLDQMTAYPPDDHASFGDIGRDFLTWLWSNPQPFASIQNKIVVTGRNGEQITVKTSGGYLASIVGGLADDRSIAQAIINLTDETNGNEALMNLYALTFSCRLETEAINPPEDADDVDGPLLERMYLIERAFAGLDSVYKTFLQVKYGNKNNDEAA